MKKKNQGPTTLLQILNGKKDGDCEGKGSYSNRPVWLFQMQFIYHRDPDKGKGRDDHKDAPQ